MRRVLLGWMAAVLVVRAADFADAQLLNHIRARMSRTLSQLPHYACRETIQRSLRHPGSATFEPRDVIRVDVAFLSDRELYAWPGTPFGEEALFEMVPEGAIGT